MKSINKSNYAPHVFFSNRLELLYHQLKSELFGESHPFTKRMIIVSSPAIKSWLTLQIAQDPDLEIALGIDICFADPALHRLSLMFSPDQSSLPDMPAVEPSELELCLALEQEMSKIVHVFPHLAPKEKGVWAPLLAYLNISPETLTISRRSSKRITALSGTLARYFLDYGLFGGRIIEQWNGTEAAHWQQALWQTLEGLVGNWNIPYRKFKDINMESISQPDDLQVHLFGLSYCAPVHHNFLMKIAEYVPVNYYLISPCQKFWTDLLSDKESVYLKAYWHKRGVAEVQLEKLDGYLRDTNPLLANFGKLGREMIRQIEESHMIAVEKYALPATILGNESYNHLLDNELLLHESSHSFTLLEAIQSDIVLLRNPDEGAVINFIEYDGTIQIHAAPKPMREVEAIYNAILGILDKHRLDETPILSSDVIVMTPNIEAYAPFIRSVFGAPESVVDYQIMDLEMSTQYPYVQAFLHLLHLPLGRWDAVSLLRLFEYQAFQERHRLTWEDVQEVRKWIKIAGIRWGKDQRHRNEMLQRDHCHRQMVESSENNTWEHGLGRLLEGLAMFTEGHQTLAEENNFYPIERIETTQSELLGKIIYILRSLLEDLRPLSDSTQLSAKEWALYLKCLCDTYLSSEKDDDDSGCRELMQEINAFEKVLPQLDNATYLFHSIQRQIEQALNRKSAYHRESHMQAIRFCSLLPMRSIPAKVIVLMGMNDGIFPRADDHAKLNYLLGNSEADYYPSQIDFDRHLFLEALLSARRYLLLSYVNQVNDDPKEQSSSLLITELIAYLDKAFRLPSGNVSSYCMTKHALLPFDKRYFTANYPYRSYNTSHYAAALSYYIPEKHVQPQFITDFNAHTITEEHVNDIIIELSELTACARNPLKIYFNKALGIFLEREEDRTLPCDEEWKLSHLDTALISREALFSTVPNTLLRAEKMGKLPPAPFREIGTDKIKKEIESLSSNLKMHGINPKDVFAIEFSERFHEIKCSGSCWEMPALTVTTPRGIHVRMIGRIETVTLQGLVVFGEDTAKENVKGWPMSIAFCSLIKRYQLPIVAALLFIKGKAAKAKVVNFENPDVLLGRYIDYFFDSKKSPSPLLPEWTASILEGDRQELQEMFNNKGDDPFNPIYDDYLKWIGRNTVNIDAASTVQHWQGKAQELFHDLI